MTLNEYQEEAHTTSKYNAVYAIPYNLYQLSSEVGELCRLWSKSMLNQQPVDMDLAKKELGDILWHIAEFAYHQKWPLDDVAVTNLEKLSGRAQRGTIQGHGDNR